MEKIAMKCARPEYESIREFVGELTAPNEKDFEQYNYLHTCKDNIVFMYIKTGSCRVYETFDKDVFLKACGIDFNKIILDQVKEYFKDAVEVVSCGDNKMLMSDFNFNTLEVLVSEVWIEGFNNGPWRILYNLDNKKYAKIITTTPKINLLDVEEALGKDTIFAINTRIKKDKRTTMFKKALKIIKALDDEHCNITYIGTDSGYAINSQGDTELDGSFTITITGNKTK